ncbi:sigma-70 family RNA polymerase sigma factor [Spongiivirga citrea]|uniref:Sigma-70 family RNA polymerase sigma factor n=1 Tax=Spongiivirga citrea TaxID=1481457 RepID=A0A6M0CRF4_9FLAO|nr:sigma-70 family RNA polymerase sigma factor [Spongiivirga citrea]
MEVELNKQKEFIDIVKKHKGILYKVITMYCADYNDRKDLEQDILIQIWKSLDTYDDNYALTTWLYRISMNVAISNHRKTFKKKSNTTRINGDLLEFTSNSDVNERSYQQDVLYRLLNELNKFDKALMFLYLEDKDYEVIADVLGITKTNVATKISRIKNKWKQQLSQQKQ